jgi:hypothetical protein
MANVYRMKGDLQNVAATLEKALGKVEEYGSKGITASKAASTITCSAWNISTSLRVPSTKP